MSKITIDRKPILAYTLFMKQITYILQLLNNKGELFHIEFENVEARAALDAAMKAAEHALSIAPRVRVWNSGEIVWSSFEKF